MPSGFRCEMVASVGTYVAASFSASPTYWSVSTMWSSAWISTASLATDGDDSTGEDVEKSL